MSQRKKYLNRNIIVTLAAIFVLTGVFLITTRSISQLDREACYRQMEQSTAEFGDKIYGHVESERGQLEAIAQIIANYETVDSKYTRDLLSSFESRGLISRLEILFPDGRVLRRDGQFAGASDLMSYQEVAARGIHISGRETDFNGSPILRSYVPIMKNGVDEAVLYGIVELSRLPEFCEVMTLDGDAQLYLVDGQNGDILLDTWNKTLGNIREMDSWQVMGERGLNQIAADMAAGRSGSAAFSAESTGDYYYSYYKPVGVNDWVVMLIVPEGAAFAGARKTTGMLYALAAVETVLLAMYFLWIFSGERRSSHEKERQLGRVRFMLDVEKLLFDVPRHSSQMELALERVASEATAEQAFFLIFDGARIKREMVWQAEAKPDMTSLACFPAAVEFFRKASCALVYDVSSFMEEYPKMRELLREMNVRSLMLVPVLDMDEAVIGILGAVNMRRRWESAELLESVALSFSMAYSNIKAFQRIEELGSVDHLTGLKNRNRYQAVLEQYEKGNDFLLACVYLDANGLHEINNRLGHSYGDHMLQTVANALKKEFGEDTYRIGGDEFVAFSWEPEKEVLERKVQNLKHSVGQEHYHVSVGVEWRRAVPLVDEMVKSAERKMYREKKSYYQEKNDLENVREMNRELEKILTEKKDLEKFCSVIAPKYKGVYVVNLNLNTIRPIYIPPYFRRAVDASGGRFSRALQIYVEENVRPEYAGQFQELLEYDRLIHRLESGDKPGLRYQKRDKTWVSLYICRSPSYTERHRETIWLFEDMESGDV